MKYTKEYILSDLLSEGWVVVEKPDLDQKYIYAYNPEFFDSYIVKILYKNWVAGVRPSLQSLIEPTEYVRHIFAKEGWELLSEYKGKDKHLFIRHPIHFNGHVVKANWGNWNKGIRPCTTRSLVDPTAYIKEQIEPEGWEVIDSYNNGKILLKHKHKFNGHVCSILWTLWSAGVRPGMQSLVNPTLYVKEELEKEGWRLLNNYKTANENLIIENPDVFMGNRCYMTWAAWKQGTRPSMKSLINPTNYVFEFLYNMGYKPTNKSWKYKNTEDFFSITNIKTGKEIMVNWSSIKTRNLSSTPRKVIYNRIVRYLRYKNGEKDFSLTKLFGEEYLDELNKKFPLIPSGYHIDHIVPLSFFGNTLEQMKIANEPRNLRLLTAKENMARSNRLKTSELDQYNLWDIYNKAENPDNHLLFEDRYELVR